MNKKLTRWIIWILALCGILIAVSLLALCVGSAGIPFKKIISLFFEGKDTAGYSIIFDIRLPRILLALAVGSALSISGVILQGIFRNPLVEPYTLGISGGAALGVAVVIALGLSLFIPIAGFVGAMLCVSLIYFISNRQGSLRISTLLLTGVMISFIAGSMVMFIMSVSGSEELHSIVFWIMGSLEEPDWFLIKTVSLVTIIGLIISLLFSNELNVLGLGEEGALHLGVNVERTKKILFALASLLTGCSVSVAGIIGFVGLVVPHFMRILVGNDHRILILSSALAGGVFLLICDTLARTIISPLELPVGVITGIVGGIVFIYFLTRRKNKC